MEPSSRFSPDRERRAARRTAVGALLLAVLVIALFGRTVTFEFVNYDDNVYVYDNPRVTAGLTLSGAAWALGDMEGNWHPLTWLAHQTDVTLFGLEPWGHHLHNLLLHLLCTLLLFLFILRLTGRRGGALLVAALFAVHPLHVQSVAWISERKDVLSTALWLAALLAWVGYLRRGRIDPAGGGSRFVPYGAALAFFALSLAAKPMPVTMPALMLLLDFWPLGRLGGPGGNPGGVSLRRVLVEKLPFVMLAGISSVLTVIAQDRGRSVSNLVQLPVGERVANALAAYGAYLVDFVAPRNLAVFYPLPVGGAPAWQATAAGVALVVVTVAAAALACRRGWLALGWGWFLVTLLPVIGLVQVGDQARGDRYTYVPYIGLFVIAAWGVPALLGRRPGWRRWLPAAGAVWVLVLAGFAWREVGYWRNTATIMGRAIETTTENYVGHNNLGSYLHDIGRIEEAIPHFEATLRMRPAHASANYNLGVAYLQKGMYTQAVERFRWALHVGQDDPEARQNMGAALMALGRYAEAAEHFRRALELRPGWPEAASNLGVARAKVQRGGPPGSVNLTTAGQGAAGRAQVHFQAGRAMHEQGQEEQAVAQLREALRLFPDYPEARELLGAILARRAVQ